MYSCLNFCFALKGLEDLGTMTKNSHLKNVWLSSTDDEQVACDCWLQDPLGKPMIKISKCGNNITITVFIISMGLALKLLT